MRIKLLSPLLFVFFIVACNKPPKACIEIDKSTAAIGETVTLTSCSKRALSFIWSMSGPSGAPENTLGWSDEVIQNVFTIPGTYTVTLEAYKKYSFLGDVSTTTASITIQ